MKTPWIYCSFSGFYLVLNYYLATAHLFNYPSANLSTTWINNESVSSSFGFIEDSRIRPILVGTTIGLTFACGFVCQKPCASYLFAIFIVQTTNESNFKITIFGDPQIVWSANRDYLVWHDAMLNLTATGELVLHDVDGSIVWTTNTTGKSVAGMNITDNGNLLLFDAHNRVVWQSFDYPTDCLVSGQTLFQGHKMIPSVSLTSFTAQKGLYYLEVTDRGLSAYVESTPPQIYNGYLEYPTVAKGRRYVRFMNGNLSLYIHSVEASDRVGVIHIQPESSAKYMRFMPDGHLAVFQWINSLWKEMSRDLINSVLEKCDYPLACGKNALCFDNQQCSCPTLNSPTIEYFKAVNNRQPSLGCSEITAIKCNDTQHQVFIAVENVKFSSFITFDMVTMNIETCKQGCLNNCSCKVALFIYDLNSIYGYCSQLTDLFTMTILEPNINKQNISAFIKVQNVRSPPSSTSQSPVPLPKRKRRFSRVVSGSIIGSFMLVLVVVGFIIVIMHKRKFDVQREEGHIDQVTGMQRFSYEELKTATENFSKKLGEGGFGAVFEGQLKDGSKIAVKSLEVNGRVNKSFLAEVESIGNIHHVNLVRLRGIGAWKFVRFLVYDFMSNGSLDKWIYYKNRDRVLDWECRKKIILDIAKGLAYLHEDCSPKVIHLDIKPQNILLDNDFNAKVSDFGLSKLMARSETEVMTSMRGTPGYIAPDWLRMVITEKVDVYSFGVVLLEILSAKKQFDISEPEESRHLVHVFQKAWEKETLLDLVDKYSEDMQTHSTEVMKMIQMALWCLQIDFERRPSMSTIVKVLEGVMNVESDLDYDLVYRGIYTPTQPEKNIHSRTSMFISGPRS